MDKGPSRPVTLAHLAPCPDMRSTGLASADAQDDFLRVRRRRQLARLGATLRREPDDVSTMLPFDEVVEALGRVGARDLGLQTIPLDSIVGSVDRARDFDRHFRPTSARVRPRWERIAHARRRGESMPPIDVFRVGDLHFVRDGHHRVSVARAQGDGAIEARVREVVTRLPAETALRSGELAVKSHERLFRERVPLPSDAAARIELSDPWQYGALAEGVEAWGFRVMQHDDTFLPRDEAARRWYEQEYKPVVALLREAGLLRSGETETDGYARLSAERYRLMRTQEWTDDVVDRLRRA
jgi:hypothetical protein